MRATDGPGQDDAAAVAAVAAGTHRNSSGRKRRWPLRTGRPRQQLSATESDDVIVVRTCFPLPSSLKASPQRSIHATKLCSKPEIIASAPQLN